MAIQPNPRFPLLESDQADVIRIFLQLVQERIRAESVPEEKTVIKTPGACDDSNDSFFPGDAFDYE
ncbi:MAG TPA: hypothetical protein VME23_16080 [Terracidiphilus sp.]|nr:hypothetical protein [Terracidiphilus sp.]